MGKVISPFHDFRLVRRSLRQNEWKCERCGKYVILERVRPHSDSDKDAPPVPSEAGVCRGLTPP